MLSVLQEASLALLDSERVSEQKSDSSAKTIFASILLPLANSAARDGSEAALLLRAGLCCLLADIIAGRDDVSLHWAVAGTRRASYRGRAGS